VVASIVVFVVESPRFDGEWTVGLARAQRYLRLVATSVSSGSRRRCRVRGDGHATVPSRLSRPRPSDLEQRMLECGLCEHVSWAVSGADATGITRSARVLVGPNSAICGSIVATGVETAHRGCLWPFGYGPSAGFRLPSSGSLFRSL